jgi:hypothetical protein
MVYFLLYWIGTAASFPKTPTQANENKKAILQKERKREKISWPLAWHGLGGQAMATHAEKSFFS